MKESTRPTRAQAVIEQEAPSAVVIESEQGITGAGTSGTGETRTLAPVSNLIDGSEGVDRGHTPVESRILEERVQFEDKTGYGWRREESTLKFE
jgi:hypothetical protein